MGLRVNVFILIGWLFAVAVVGYAALVLLPLTGAEVFRGLEGAGCRPLSLCVDEPVLPPETRVEFVEMRRMLDCQRYGAGECTDLLTQDESVVHVFVSDAYYEDSGIVLSEGAFGRELRYLELISRYGSEYGSFYCAYGDGPVTDEVAALSVGDSVVFTANLRVLPGFSQFRTYDADGNPGCVLKLLDGKPWDE